MENQPSPQPLPQPNALPLQEAAQPEQPAKRRPGRPKRDPSLLPAKAEKVPGKRGRPKKEVDPNAPAKAKGKPGRPAKPKPTEEELALMAANKRKPGRPKKEADANAPQKTKGKAGRPKKDKAALSGAEVLLPGANDAGRRRPGRPKKAVDPNAPVVEKRKPGRPKKAVETSAEQPTEKRKPGRPKRLPAPEAQPSIQGKRSITFRINYSTRFGESIYLSGQHPLLGNGHVSEAVPLAWQNDQAWAVTIDFEGELPNADVSYNYVLRNADGSLSYDWGRDKSFNLARMSTDQLTILDSWNHPGFFENAYFTEPFQQVLLREQQTPHSSAQPEQFTHEFRIKAPLLKAGEKLIISGQGEGLGNWQTANPLVLSRTPGKEFHHIRLNLSNHAGPLVYKYAILNSLTGEVSQYEQGNNRYQTLPASTDKPVVVNDGFIQLPAEFWKGAGVAIPVFSLRSRDSFGTGEFADLMPLADWASSLGMKLIQILPVNDTTANKSYTDSYPYSAISAFALHPLYLNLRKLAGADLAHIYQRYESTQADLNSRDHVDYEPVMKTKWAFIDEVYPLLRDRSFASQDYADFYLENADWLLPYAQFCYLRDLYGTTEYGKWPAYSHYNPLELAALLQEGSDSRWQIEKHFFIQYHLHCQLLEATNYCRSKGVVVKGDIPIGIYRNGVDAWQNPALYHLDKQAGAPPDDFAATGQNWGFPTYNWHRMMEDGFAWWKQRFNQMSHYFDAFRIDHILGFFRIWSIPSHAIQGIMGVFVPALPIHAAEFGQRGIHFDYHRLCKPFINEHVLWTLFGELRDLVKQDFLQVDGHEHYSLKPQFSTQVQVNDYLGRHGADYGDQVDALREGLFNLIANVILFEVEGSQGQDFHFRIEAQKTLSFQQLDGHQQQLIDALYVDYFFRRQNDFWRQEAMQKLPVLKSVTNMLICGEDLGMVPDCVPGVMKDLGLLSLEIQRMPKDPKRRFFHPNDAPYLSVVTPSTHDMSTLRGWWEEDRAASQHFFNHELGNWGQMPYYCEDWVVRQIVNQHLYSPAMWCIFMLQDLLGIDKGIRLEDPHAERINVPADPKHFWKYRMHLGLEDLMAAEGFNEDVREMVKKSGRG